MRVFSSFKKPRHRLVNSVSNSIIRTLVLFVPVLSVLEYWLYPRTNFSHEDQMDIRILGVKSRNDKIQLKQRSFLLSVFS